MSEAAPPKEPDGDLSDGAALGAAKAVTAGALRGALTGGLGGAVRGAVFAAARSKAVWVAVAALVALPVATTSVSFVLLQSSTANMAAVSNGARSGAVAAAQAVVNSNDTLNVLQSAAAQTGVRWEALTALWAAEKGKSATGRGVGPFAIDMGRAKGITAADAGDLSKAAVFVGSALKTAESGTVDRLQDPDLEAGTLIGTTPSGAQQLTMGTTDDQKAAQAAVKAQYTAAFGTLPLDGMPGAAASVYASTLSIALGQASSCSSGGSQVALGGSTSVALNDKQKGYAQAIINEAAARGLPSAAAVVALSVALQESTLQMYWNANVPGSQELADGGPEGGHDMDAFGGVSYSVGLFQQQVHGSDFPWGTVQDAMSPAKSTDMFLDRLVKIPGWDTMPVTVAAQTVQGSMFPDAYAKWAQEAGQLVADLKPTVGSGAGALVAPSASAQPSPPPVLAPTGGAAPSASASPTPTPASGSGTTTGACGGGTYGVGVSTAGGVDDYPYRDLPGDSITDPWSLFNGECVSFVAWRMNQQLGWKQGQDYPFTPAKFGLALFGNATDWKDNLGKAGFATDGTPKPGSIAWWGAYGAPGIGPEGHVAVVKQVNPDGTIFIEEYNFLPDADHSYHTRTIPASSVNGFIHVADNPK